MKQCYYCGRLIMENDDLSYGCPNCESNDIREYQGIIGEYTRRTTNNGM